MNLKDRNIVLVVMDSLSAFRTPIHGYDKDTTPFLKELAEENTVADFCYSNSCWSLPSHASILSGKLPSVHGATAETMKFEGDTVVDDMNEKGYRSIGVTPNYFVNSNMGFGDGFDFFTDHQSEVFLKSERKAFRAFQHQNRLKYLNYLEFLARTVVHREPSSLRKGWEYRKKGWGMEDKGAENINSLINREIEDFEEDNFFALATYMEIHHPKDLPEDAYIDDWIGEENPSEKFQDDNRNPAAEGRYDSATRYVDSKLKELYESVTEKYPDTVFIITSDHGHNQGYYKVGDNSFWGHQYALTENTIRVPFVIAGQDIPDRNIEENVSHTEIRSLINGEKEIEELGQEEVRSEYFGAYNFAKNPSEKGFSNILHQLKNLNKDRIIKALKQYRKGSEVNRFYMNESEAIISGRDGYIRNSVLPDHGFHASKDSLSEENLKEETSYLKERL